MKIEKLFLTAFGPFTDRVLDFAGPANFHLIYGPNEAGKSSALRAMGDLRFGIPTRSTDNFIHEHGRMLLAGVFADAAGERIALARRKGKGQTLLGADPTSGQPLANTPVAATIERALTGGMERKQFEVMFGLDHQRLREGGELLLRADGELGSALFEASAGTRGVTALLSALQEDSRRYFSPRAQQATLNEASRQIDEHKHAYRHALIKPAEWKDRQRAHEAAKAKLAEMKVRLGERRRRDSELTELRAVQPLLKQYDATLATLDELAAVPLLSFDARNTRLIAEQALQGAQKNLALADAVLVKCAQENAQLVVEPALLEHATAIERLITERDAASRSRVELRQIQAEVDTDQLKLAAIARKIAADRPVADVLAAVPSATDRVMLDEHLAQCRSLQERLNIRRERVSAIQQKLQQHAADSGSLVDLALRQAVEEAVRRAQTMGDFAERHDKLQCEIDGYALRLQQALTDLGFSSAQQLQNSRPLLAAEVTAAEQEINRFEAEINTLHNDETAIKRDLQEQQRLQQTLSAMGEVVTAQTLRTARARRDTGWGLVRKAYVLRSETPETLAPDFDPVRTLPEAFEASQNEADRQADLLREGAERATKVAECEIRIAEMTTRLQEMAHHRQTNALAQGKVQADWLAKLSAASLPVHQPAALREWLTLRAAALDLVEHHTRVSNEQSRLLGEAERAAADLRTVLSAAGEIARADAQELNTLIAQAAGWIKAMIEAAAKQKERHKAIKDLEDELQSANLDINMNADALSTHQGALARWHAQLFLAPASLPAAIKARLDELDALEKAHADLDQRQARIRKLTTIQNALLDQAGQLVALLGEPVFEHVDDFVDRVQGRLIKSKAANTTQGELERRAVAAQCQKQDAEADRLTSEATLLVLCQAAGVNADSGKLHEVEEQSARKRQMQEKAEVLTGQLREASTRTLAELREALAGLDVVATDTEREQCRTSIKELEEDMNAATEAEQVARVSLYEIDTSDHAAEAREQMESAIARYCAGVKPWAQLKLAESLLQEALRRFRDRSQAPMVTLASEYFSLVTSGRYQRLIVDDSAGQPVLQAERGDGCHIGVDAMSEGTADQLYLALRLAALELQRNADRQMPLILDDALITSDDERAANVFSALARFAAGGQVMLFTHHRHLIDIANRILPADVLATHSL